MQTNTRTNILANKADENVNDINRHVHLGACNLYADDTLVYCNGSTMSELKHNIQQCVSDILDWYDQNKLVIVGETGHAFCNCDLHGV